MSSGGYAGAPRCGVGLPEASPQAPVLARPTLAQRAPTPAGRCGERIADEEEKAWVGRAFDGNGKRESEEFSSELPSISVLDFLPLFSLFLPSSSLHLPYLPLSLLSFSWGRKSFY